MKKAIRLLFIGNSHTYYNDMPLFVRDMAQTCGYTCDVTMLARGGWSLEQHVNTQETRFNILFGRYDYVILQERSHPFAPEEKYRDALSQMDEWIRQAGAKAVIYETWAKKNEPDYQAEMNRIQHGAADALSAILAPVGENWWAYQQARPDIELYAQDGAHASASGSEFAAKIIWEAILADLSR